MEAPGGPDFSQTITDCEVWDRVKTVPNFQISGSFVDPLEAEVKDGLGSGSYHQGFDFKK